MSAFRRGSRDEEKSAICGHLHDEFSAARKTRRGKSDRVNAAFNIKRENEKKTIGAIVFFSYIREGRSRAYVRGLSTEQIFVNKFSSPSSLVGFAVCTRRPVLFAEREDERFFHGLYSLKS